MGAYRTIVVGTDGSETSFRAVDRAAALAASSDATLVIACAYFPERPDPRAQDVLGDEAYQVMGSAPADRTLSRARERAASAHTGRGVRSCGPRPRRGRGVLACPRLTGGRRGRGDVQRRRRRSPARAVDSGRLRFRRRVASARCRPAVRPDVLATRVLS